MTKSRCQAAARAAGRKSGNAVAYLVDRFNRDGLAALDGPQHGGQPERYTGVEHERTLQAVRLELDWAQDRAVTWSLTTRQRVFRRTPDGLPAVSTYINLIHAGGRLPLGQGSHLVAA